MLIHIIRKKATREQMADMSNALGTYIKVAVDIKRGILAGGGELHADCESELLKDGSCQEDIWGADWYPDSQEVRFESLINIRPRQDNRSMTIQDQKICSETERIIRSFLEGI